MFFDPDDTTLLDWLATRCRDWAIVVLGSAFMASAAFSLQIDEHVMPAVSRLKEGCAAASTAAVRPLLALWTGHGS